MTKLAKFSACVAAVLLIVTPASAKIGVNVDVLWNPNPDDDLQVFLHMSNVTYPQPRERVVAVFHQIPDPYGDYPVLAFISHHGHVDIGTVWTYKRKGHNWFNVMLHFGVRPSVLFVNLSRPPGPPYGKAYGHWRKHGNRMQQEHITNDDIRFWVGLHAVSSFAGLPPARVIEWRESGKKFPQIAGNQYREKHAKGKDKKVHDASLGHGKGRGKGHDKERD